MSDVLLVYSFLGPALRWRLACEYTHRLHMPQVFSSLREAQQYEDVFWWLLKEAGYNVPHLKRVARVYAGLEV